MKQHQQVSCFPRKKNGHGCNMTVKQSELRAQEFKKSNDPSDLYLGRQDRVFLSGRKQESLLPLRQRSSKIRTWKDEIAVDDIDSITRKLSSKSLDANHRSSNGETILHVAVLKQNVEIVKALLDAGADPLIQIPDFQEERFTGEYLEISSKTGSSNGATALHYACGTGNTVILEVILENIRGKDLDIGRNEKCGTPLLWAIECTSFECVSLLLAYGADVQVLDAVGNTFAMAAVLYANERDVIIDQENRMAKLLRVLVKAGIDLNQRNDAGHTAFDLVHTKHKRALQVIISDLGGLSGKIHSVRHLFCWNMDASRREWTFQNGSKHRKVIKS